MVVEPLEQLLRKVATCSRGQGYPGSVGKRPTGTPLEPLASLRRSRRWPHPIPSDRRRSRAPGRHRRSGSVWPVARICFGEHRRPPAPWQGGRTFGCADGPSRTGAGQLDRASARARPRVGPLSRRSRRPRRIGPSPWATPRTPLRRGGEPADSRVARRSEPGRVHRGSLLVPHERLPAVGFRSRHAASSRPVNGPPVQESPANQLRTVASEGAFRSTN